MRIYDVTLPIRTGILVWPGDPSVSVETKTTIKKHGVKLSFLSFSTHTGTHVDAPSHFLGKGVDLDKVPLEKFIGPCQVVDLTSVRGREIAPSDLLSIRVKKGDRILFKTGNFKLLRKKTFSSFYISLSLAGAQFLASKKIHLVGTDFLGIEKKSAPGHPVHKTLLSAGIVIVEGLDLAHVPAGRYQLFCLPLNVVGVDGAPARVILVQ